MKTFTLSQFKTLVNNGKWETTNYTDNVDYYENEVDCIDKDGEVSVKTVRTNFGFGVATSAFADLEIKWTEGFSWIEGEGGFNASTEGMDKPLEMNFQVVENDDQDEMVYASELIEFLPRKFMHIDFSAYDKHM